ncbi:DUF2007 domain-containing protein [Pseudohoeflea coraliihabitans]|uniref:DUF2007 domain-containing protein n=1 Tax=Pseudohoeflea coraliihabitans TaxID=2860393 RepID=A0ABS6WNI0_9HYPH|nr:DUF2007 domain-containing protein [Pseudohoeflea sp. DP4N28-3]MBW3096972.1 DUF2007 domain-containing protein [Pseudohoeflea sp. DP4N28-3]
MHELIRTNDAVLISFVETLMEEAGVGYFIADANMSILEGSIGMLPRRILVDPSKAALARRIAREAGLAHELRPWQEDDR